MTLLKIALKCSDPSLELCLNRKERKKKFQQKIWPLRSYNDRSYSQGDKKGQNKQEHNYSCFLFKRVPPERERETMRKTNKRWMAALEKFRYSFLIHIINL